MSRARALGAVPLLVLALGLSGCGGGDGAKKSSAAPLTQSPTPSLTATPTDLPTDLPTELPTGLPTDLPTGLPTDLSSELPTDVPTPSPTQAAGGPLDGCAVLTPALLTADLGAGSSGKGLSQASSYGDPNAKDCYYIGGDATVVVQATTRADADLPAESNTYEGLPGAQPVPGADRGWVFATSAQGSTTAGLILVKGQHGINCSIIVAGQAVSMTQLQKLAQDALANL